MHAKFKSTQEKYLYLLKQLLESGNTIYLLNVGHELSMPLILI